MSEEITKTTLRVPKKLVKELKQFGLNNDKSLTEIAVEAFNEYLERRRT
jgi:predicted transcriptional regulator